MLIQRRIGVALALAIVASGAGVGATALAGALTGASTNNPGVAADPAPAAVPGQAVVPATSTATHYLTLSAAALAPDHLADTSEDYFNAWNPASLSSSDSARCFNTGVTLPTNAAIKSITVYYVQGTTGMVFAELNRQSLADHTSTILASFTSTTGASATYTSATEAVAKSVGAVNYQLYSYGVGVCPSGDATFSDIQIAYTLR